MNATRPRNVPADATLIYPGQTYGPGYGVQQATIARIESIIGRGNANTMLHYANAYVDWAANASQYEAYGMPVPPAPARPAVQQLEIIYATVGGDIVAPPEGADGLHYAWIWQVTA